MWTWRRSLGTVGTVMCCQVFLSCTLVMDPKCVALLAVSHVRSVASVVKWRELSCWLQSTSSRFYWGRHYWQEYHLLGENETQQTKCQALREEEVSALQDHPAYTDIRMCEVPEGQSGWAAGKPFSSKKIHIQFGVLASTKIQFSGQGIGCTTDWRFEGLDGTFTTSCLPVHWHSLRSSV